MALSGKVALVTGASQGLGKGFCDILLKNGAKVAMLDINETAGKSTIADFAKEYGEDHVSFLTCDVSSDEQLKDAFQKTKERFGRIDIVNNNVGILDEANFKKMVEVNLIGVIQGTYLALQHMKKENGGEGGVVINTASLAGVDPFLLTPAYTATKHGVVGFTRAMADASKAGGYGVRFNVLCPSAVRTPLFNVLIDEKSENFGPFGHLYQVAIGQKRIGTLEVPVVAERFLQLVTDEKKNGAVMMVTDAGAAYINYPEGFMNLPMTPVP